MTVRGKNVLRKTESKYIGETKRLLRYLGVPQAPLEEYKESRNPLQRSPKLKPKVEYCALEWREVQRICIKSRTAMHIEHDNLLGRAILTFAETRVGSILPPKYNKGKKSISQLHGRIFGR